MEFYERLRAFGVGSGTDVFEYRGRFLITKQRFLFWRYSLHVFCEDKWAMLFEEGQDGRYVLRSAVIEKLQLVPAQLAPVTSENDVGVYCYPDRGEPDEPWRVEILASSIESARCIWDELDAALHANDR